MRFTTRLSLFLTLMWWLLIAAVWAQPGANYKGGGFSEWMNYGPGMWAMVYGPFLVFMILRALAFVFRGR